MIKEIQLEIKSKTQNIYENVKKSKKLDNFSRQRMERLGHEQNSLGEITKKFIKMLQGGDKGG